MICLVVNIWLGRGTDSGDRERETGQCGTLERMGLGLGPSTWGSFHDSRVPYTVCTVY